MLDSGSRVTDADDEDDSNKARRRAWGGYQYFTPRLSMEEELLNVD